MTRKPTLYLSSVRHHFFVPFIFIFMIAFGVMPLKGQNIVQPIGHWQLDQVRLKKIVAKNSEQDKDLFLTIFKTALYEKLTNEQQLQLETLEWTNYEAEKLRDTYFRSDIEFKLNGAFYNTSQKQSTTLNGEYLLLNKTLLMEWETADKNKFKVLKITESQLVLKDNELKIIFDYIKPKPTKS